MLLKILAIKMQHNLPLVIAGLLISGSAYSGSVTSYRMTEISPDTDHDFTFTFSVNDLNEDGVATSDEIFGFSGIYCAGCTNIPDPFKSSSFGPLNSTLGKNDTDLLFGGSGEATLNLTNLAWTYTITGATKTPGLTGWGADVAPRTLVTAGFTWSDARGNGNPIRVTSLTGAPLWQIEAIAAPHDVTPSSQFTATQYLMTSSSSANVTRLHVVNHAATSQTFKGTLYNGQGERLGSASQPLSQNSVAAKGRLTLNASDLETIFHVAPWTGPAMLDVTGTGLFDLMGKLESPSGLISNTNCVRENSVSNIEGMDSQDKTFIRFINASEQVISDIKGTLFDSEGNVIGTPEVLLIGTLNAKAARWIQRDALGDLIGDTWMGEATLQVTDKAGLKLLNLNFTNNETFFNFSCYQSAHN